MSQRRIGPGHAVAGIIDPQSAVVVCVWIHLQAEVGEHIAVHILTLRRQDYTIDTSGAV
jgi:hypothetical protein